MSLTTEQWQLVVNVLQAQVAPINGVLQSIAQQAAMLQGQQAVQVTQQAAASEEASR